MKYILSICIILIQVVQAYAQCPATEHKLSGTFVTTVSLSAGQHDKTDYTEEDICDYDGWLLAFEDDFNGNQIDESIWQQAWCNPGAYNECPVSLYDTSNFIVRDGSLFMTSKINPANGKTINPAIQTKRQFPSGKVQVRVKLPAIPDVPEDLAPLWMRSTLDYTDTTYINDTVHSIAVGAHKYYAKEIDIEFFNGSRSTGTYTLWHDDDVINETQISDDNSDISGHSQAGSCYTAGSMTDGNWHIFEIEWDMWHVNWHVDDVLVNSFTRTYEPVYPFGQGQWWSGPPLSLVEVNECSGAPADNFDYNENWMFPLFANMPINISGLGAYNGLITATNLPYTMEIDYVKFFRKIKCDKDLILPPNDLNPIGGYRSAGGIGCDRSSGDQVPPTLDNQTPSVITGRTISVAGDTPYIFRRDDYMYYIQQNLDLYATQEINLLPGFETDLLYQANPPCGPQSYGSAPWITYYGNNWTIQDVFSASIVLVHRRWERKEWM